MTAYSLLDLVPVVEGGTVAQALANAADLARHAEALGFTRYWVAEHHGMAGIASAATAVVIAHVAAATATIRVGAGGIMLPNHAPLVIAEQFGTLDALFPGRIDLGLGRAPGSDQRVARAMRRTLESDANAFPQDVMELQSYFADDGQTGIRATPGAGAKSELWILGRACSARSSRRRLGCPMPSPRISRPTRSTQALAIYRRDFRPSAVLAKPHAMAGFNVFAADTDEEAELLASVAAAGVRRAAHRQPAPAAAAGAGLSRDAGRAGRGDPRSCPVLLRGRRAGQGPRASSRRSSSAPASTR